MQMTEKSVEEVAASDEDFRIAISTVEEKTLSSLRKYLSSSVFYDVGRVTARRVVSHFGIRTAQVIESAPRELMRVPGVGPIRMQAIQSGWSYQKRLIEKSAEIIKIKFGSYPVDPWAEDKNNGASSRTSRKSSGRCQVAFRQRSGRKLGA
jgi:ATP-dependent exoDNAse (exonuclease V) alpha subunit